MRMYNSRKSTSLIEPAQSPFEKEGTEPVSVFCESDYAEVEEVLLFAEDKAIRSVELNALEHGSGDFYTKNGWYDTNNVVFKES